MLPQDRRSRATFYKLSGKFSRIAKQFYESIK